MSAGSIEEYRAEQADWEVDERPEVDGIKPGLHFDLPNDDYHALTDWWSSTQLKKALPEHYQPGGSSEALSFGSLVHSVVLEPDSLDQYVPADADVIGIKADGTRAENPTMTKAWKSFVVEAEQDGKTVIAQADWDKAHRMRDSIAAHPVAASLLFDCDGTNEESAFWVDRAGIRHKARFDRRIPGAIIDLKTTSAKPGLRSLVRACIDYGYDLSAAHYLAVAAGLGLDASEFVHVWVGKVEPYRVTVTDLDPLFIQRGQVLRDLALERAQHRAEPYEGATDRLTLICPEWALPFDDEMEIA